MENLNNKACYPYTYGDKDGQNPKISDYVVKVTKNERFQRHMGSVGLAILGVVTSVQPVTAIPPEYGEAAANIADAVGQNVPPFGEVAGTWHGASSHCSAHPTSRLSIGKCTYAGWSLYV